MDKQLQGNLKRAPVPHPTDACAERHSRAVLVASGPSSAGGAVRSGWKRYARGEDGRGRGRRIDAARARAGDGGSRAGSREKLLATRRWIKGARRRVELTESWTRVRGECGRGGLLAGRNARERVSGGHAWDQGGLIARIARSL